MGDDRCYYCYGSGHRTETRTELDTTMSVVLGAAMGTGLFPSYKTVTEEIPCTWCHGTGRR